LWSSEAQAGRAEGVKDRPCAIILAHQEQAGETRVYVLPLTHSPPPRAEHAIEVPAAIKARLNLDEERSWVVVTEANVFTWPGPDLRFLPGKGPASIAYGILPPRFFSALRDRFLATNRASRAKIVKRTD